MPFDQVSIEIVPVVNEGQNVVAVFDVQSLEGASSFASMLWVDESVLRLRQVSHEVFFERNDAIGKTFLQQLRIVIPEWIGDERDTYHFITEFVQVLIEF